MGRCPYCQKIIEQLKAFSKMEAKQLVYPMNKERVGDEGLDYEASENVEGSDTWVDYQCPECEAILFRDYGISRPSNDKVEKMIVDFLMGRTNEVMHIPQEKEIDDAARLLSDTGSYVLKRLSEAWLHADLETKRSMRTGFEEVLILQGKIKVVKE